MDMYSGWVWRHERKKEHDLALALLNLKAWGSKVTLESLLGRPQFPVLRSLAGVAQSSTKRSPEEIQQELAELREIFKKELAEMAPEGGK